MTLMQRTPFLSAAAQQRQSSVVVTAPVHLPDIPELFSQMFGFKGSVQLHSHLPPEGRERAKGVTVGWCSPMNPYAD